MWLGALVDKSKCEPLSLAKAKRDKLRMAKFPIDKYLHWGQGHKSLALNQVSTKFIYLMFFLYLISYFILFLS